MQDTTKTVLLVALGLAITASAFGASFAGASSSAGPSPLAALTIPLYGSFNPPAGWGWTPNNISNSLTLTVHQGDVITFHLFANDSMTHELIIDLDNSHTNTTGDAFSPQFLSKTTARDWVYTASTAGTFAFFCGIHGYAAQHGTLVVQSTGGPTTPAGDNTVLIVGGVIVVVVIVVISAAMMMRKKKP